METQMTQIDALTIIINGAKRAHYSLEEGELVKKAIQFFQKPPEEVKTEEKPVASPFKAEE